MTRMMMAAAVAAILGVVAQSTHAQGTAEYNPATGGIVLKSLANVGGLRISGPGVPANPPSGLGGFAQTTPTGVDWLFFVPLNGQVEAGPLLPTNLLQTTLEADYFVGVVITGSGNPDPTRLPLTGGIIPEPTSLAVAGAGMLGLAVIRRRRK